MHRNKSAWVIGVTVWIACIRGMQAQEPDLRWVSATAGVVPAGAVAYGREADGREQFACRGAIGGGTHLGKIASGFAGCNIGYGREVTLPKYEVLVHPQPRPVIAASAISVAERPSISAAAMAREHHPPSLPSIPPSPPNATTKRGFDENGEPYVDVRLPDGTIKRNQANGVTLIKADGTTQFVPNLFIRMDAPPPTPPELPDDPKHGRAWVEQHDRQLLDMIRTLVNQDEAEMKKFSDTEHKTAGDDVFAQIVYRTQVATFLAQER